MTQTFDLLSPVDDGTVADPSVTPDIGDNIDLATIVARLDDLTDAVAKLQSQIGKQDSNDTADSTDNADNADDDSDDDNPSDDKED